MIRLGDGSVSLNLTIKDFQNIIRWQEIATKNNQEMNLSDQDTKIKIQAIMISIKEAVGNNRELVRD